MGTRSECGLQSCRLAILLLLVLPCSFADGHCKPGWEGFGDKCYLFVNQEMTCMEAMNFCLKLETDLLEVISESENAFITSLVKRKTKDACFWLGINDLVQERQWVYFRSGKELTFTKWLSRQPDNRSPDLTEGCAEMCLHEHGHWNDVSCRFTKFFVCQMNQILE